MGWWLFAVEKDGKEEWERRWGGGWFPLKKVVKKNWRGEVVGFWVVNEYSLAKLIAPSCLITAVSAVCWQLCQRLLGRYQACLFHSFFFR